MDLRSFLNKSTFNNKPSSSSQQKVEEQKLEKTFDKDFDALINKRLTSMNFPPTTSPFQTSEINKDELSLFIKIQSSFIEHLNKADDYLYNLNSDLNNQSITFQEYNKLKDDHRSPVVRLKNFLLYINTTFPEIYKIIMSNL